MNKEIKISVRAYAGQIGVNESAVRKAVTNGKIKNGYDSKTKKIIPSIANKEYGDFQVAGKAKPGVSKELRAKQIEEIKPAPIQARAAKRAQSQKPPPNDDWFDSEDELSYEELLQRIKVTSGLSYAEAIRRREVISLAMDKKKLEEMEAVLIRRDIVDKAFFAMGDSLKKALYQIPARISAEIRSANNDVEIQNILTVEITQVLNEYANLKEIKLPEL